MQVVIGHQEIWAPAYLIEKSWLLLYARGTGDVAELFYKKCKEVGGKMGIVVGMPEMREMRCPRDYLVVYRDVIDSIKASGGQLNMVVCILPEYAKDLYDVLKQEFCLHSPCNRLAVL